MLAATATGQDIADVLVKAQMRIRRFVDKHDAPYIARIDRSGRVSKYDLWRNLRAVPPVFSFRLPRSEDNFQSLKHVQRLADRSKKMATKSSRANKREGQPVKAGCEVCSGMALATKQP